jgi:signal peptidase II
MKDYLILALVVAVIVSLDQWTKGLVRAHIPYAGSWLPDGWDWLSPYARIVHWYNSGAAFGMFQDFGGVFAILAVIVVIAIIYYFPRVEEEDWPLRLAMGMQLAGALGNLIDRLTLEGKVTDFISVWTFPVFNVADASITMGVVVLVLGVWWKERHDKKMAAQAASLPVEEPAGEASE